jgi:hypothetical protein
MTAMPRRRERLARFSTRVLMPGLCHRIEILKENASGFDGLARRARSAGEAGNVCMVGRGNSGVRYRAVKAGF